MNLIQWLLTLPIRATIRDKDRLETKQDIYMIALCLKELVDQGNRGERLDGVLEEREGSTCSTITDLQQRVIRLELERLGVSDLIPTEPVQYHAHANLEKRLATLEQALWPTTVTTPNTDAKQE